MLAALREALKKSDEHGREADRNLTSARTELGMAGKVVGAALEKLERTRYEQQPMAQQVGELISRYEELGREAKGAHDELRKQVSTLSRQLQDAEAAAEKQKAKMAESMAEVVAARVREANQYLVKERDDLYERARKAEARLEKELVPLQMEITQLRGELEDLQGPLRASLMASLMACDCV
jgi:chromosome segregation ATPase